MRPKRGSSVRTTGPTTRIRSVSVWPHATASTTSTSTARTAPRSSPTFGQASEPTWHLDDQANDRVRRGELTTEASFVRREVGQEVLVDQPERITGQLARQRSEEPEQLTEGGLLKSLIATGAGRHGVRGWRLRRLSSPRRSPCQGSRPPAARRDLTAWPRPGRTGLSELDSRRP